MVVVTVPNAPTTPAGPCADRAVVLRGAVTPRCPPGRNDAGVSSKSFTPTARAA